MIESNINHLQRKSSSVFGIPAISVCSLIAKWPQKLVNQISKRPMQLNSIKTCLFSKTKCSIILWFQSANILYAYRFGNRIFSISKRGYFFSALNGGRCPSFQITVERGMSHSACMKNLEKELGPFGMNSLNDLPPSIYLVHIEDASLPWETNSSLWNGGSFCHHESSSCPLAIIFRHKFSWNTIKLAAHPCKCR